MSIIPAARVAAIAACVILLPQALFGVDPDPLPFPVYVSCRMSGDVQIDGKLDEPVWRATSCGWGLSHSFEPNILCPDVTMFRIGHDGENVYLALACHKLQAPEPLPEHVWKPQETDLMDMQAVPRYARMRGIAPPTNTATVLISKDGRTVTLHFEPPAAPVVKVHDSLGERGVSVELEHAHTGGMDDQLWTCEVRTTWKDLGFDKPKPGDDWALNLYRDIRFFSNWSFISWMRKWSKIKYSRFDVVERFGRIIFVDQPEASEIAKFAHAIRSKRGPVRVFLPHMLMLITAEGRVVRQRYAERLKVLRTYGAEFAVERNRIGNDLPLYPFYSEKERRPHMAPASRKLNRMKNAIDAPLIWDDPASGVARISHAIPEAREGLYVWKMERLYRGLPE